MLSSIDETMRHVDILSTVDEGIDMWHRHHRDADPVDEALDQIDMMSSIDETMRHVDILSTVDEGIDMWHRHHRDVDPVDEALDHIDLLGHLDEASNFMGLPTDEDNIDELLAALPSILDEVDALTAPKSNTMMYAIIGSVSALIAIGAGFVVKQRYNVVDSDDHFESLL